MNYEETFAFVIKMTIVRTLIIVAYIFQWEDFLNGCEECLFNWGSTRGSLHDSTTWCLSQNMVKFANLNAFMFLSKHLMLGFRSFLQ